MNAFIRFNQMVAEKITGFVSTMWAAYIFAGIALISLPAAIRTGDELVIVGWVAQTFLQLVLLSIIMVGQRKGSEAVASQITETHDAVIEELAELRAVADELHQLMKKAK
jgi:hypothetical protein